MAIRREILFSFEGVGWVVVPTGLPSVCGRNSDFSHTHYQNVCASTHILLIWAKTTQNVWERAKGAAA